jgi:lysophospholipase L1-like esterase
MKLGEESFVVTIHQNNAGQISPPLYTFTESFKFFPGFKYRLTLEKDAHDLSFGISGGSMTYWSPRVSYDPKKFFGCQWGSPYFQSSNRILIKDSYLNVPINDSPELTIWGDSFIEGNSLSNSDNRYAHKIRSSLGRDRVAISGRGGESSSSIQGRWKWESKWFQNSKFALLALGANDQDFSTWKSNMLRMQSELNSKGIRVIWVTLAPRADRLKFIAEANQFIHTHLPRNAILDVADVVSHELTWKSGYVLPDGVHPSETAHEKIFEEFRKNFIRPCGNGYCIDATAGV